MTQARAYIIRANRRGGGVTLSLSGHWGNLPQGTVEAARAAAIKDAAGLPHTIAREGC